MSRSFPFSTLETENGNTVGMVPIDNPIHLQQQQQSSSSSSQPLGDLPIRNAHIPAVLRSLSESSESISMPSTEGYLSIFISSKQAQQLSSIPKYLCNFVTAILITLKLSGTQNHYPFLSWIVILLPLFISNLITFFEKLSEIHFLLITQELSIVRAFRPFASIVDLLGSFYLKITLVVYLTYEFMITNNTTLLLIPLWLTLSISIGLRIFSKDPTNSPSSSSSSSFPTEVIRETGASNRSQSGSGSGNSANGSSSCNRNRVLTIFAIGFLILQRVAQPLLIIFKLSDQLNDRTHWSIVFVPCWVTLFFVLACALLLISFAPMIHSHGNQMVKEVTKILIYLLAFQLAFGAICSISFLILLSERLDYESSNHAFGSDIPTTKILVPLIILFLGFALIHPIFMKFTIKYQEVIAALVLQRQNRPMNHHHHHLPQHPEMIVEKRKKEMYYLQISPALYALCDAHGNPISSLPQKSVRQQAKELLQTLFPSLKPQRTPPPNPSQTRSYSDILQTTDSTPNIELSTFGSSTPRRNSRDLEEGNDDDHEEPSTVLTSKDLDYELQKLQSLAEEKEKADGNWTPRSKSPENGNPNNTNNHSTSQCVVCLNHTANSIIYDCGHAVTCLPCGISIARKPPGHCPICRANITSLLEMSTKPFPLNNQKMMVMSRMGYTFQSTDLLSQQHASHSSSLLYTPHRQLLPTNRHMITNTISEFAAQHAMNTNQDSIIDILLN